MINHHWWFHLCLHCPAVDTIAMPAWKDLICIVIDESETRVAVRLKCIFQTSKIHINRYYDKQLLAKLLLNELITYVIAMLMWYFLLNLSIIHLSIYSFICINSFSLSHVRGKANSLNYGRVKWTRCLNCQCGCFIRINRMYLMTFETICAILSRASLHPFSEWL